MDEDLLNLSNSELQEKVIKLREAIRYHRDQRGDDNCWLDDFSLYDLLPEKIKSNPELPNKQLMMVNCSRYYDCRKERKLYVPLDELPKKVEFAVDWIDIRDRIPPFDIWVVVMNIDTYDVCCAYNETYNEIVMTRIDAQWENQEEKHEDGRKVIYRQIPFKITHWYPLPWYPDRDEYYGKKTS